MNHFNPAPVFTNSKSLHAFTKRYSSVLGFIILILPKCPFCLVAYSSTITLCSATTLLAHNTHHTDIGAYIAIGMGVIISACILFTYKNNSCNRLALSAAIAGLLLICLGIFREESIPTYYTGAALLVFATFIYSGFFSALFEKLRTDFK